MTSKEFDIILSKTPKSCNLYVLNEEQTNEIKKSLEILNILKQLFDYTIYLSDYYKEITADDNSLTLCLKEEEYELLKEWLDEI